MNGLHSNPHAGVPPTRRRHTGWLSGRLVFGLLLLALGALWTLDNLEVLEADSVTRWWPALLVLWGLGRLTGFLGERRPVWGAFWTVLGAALLVRAFGLVSFDLGDLWPLVLIFVGAILVYRSWRGRSLAARAGESTDGEPVLHAFTLMGGAERKVVSESFRGGDVSAVMGGAVVDLRSSKLAEGRAVIEVFAFLGGIDIVVPEGWRVIGEVTPVMGGFEDGTVLPAEANAPTLVVRGFAVMGGVEVKHTTDRGDSDVHVRRRRRRDGSVREEINIGPGGIHVRREGDKDPDD